MESRLVKHYRRIEDFLTHNGDFNNWFWGWKWNAEEYGSRTVAEWMDRYNASIARTQREYRTLLREILSGAGYGVSEAADGRQALDFIQPLVERQGGAP